MSSLAAQAAKRYRRQIKNGISHDLAFDKLLGPELVDCSPGFARDERETAVTLTPNCPTESSVRVLFPDNSGLIFDDSEVLVARLMNPSEDGSVYTCCNDLTPIMPLRRYRWRANEARYPFLGPETTLVDRALQLADIVLINKYGLGLPMWMRWFWYDRLLVKNLISAGGNEEALCSLLLGMMGNGKLALLNAVSGEEVDRSTFSIRHQTVP